MSDRLNWSPAHVTAIEENRFETLRGLAFVRGYLRAYARAVGLDEDEMLALFTAMHPEEKEELVLPAMTASATATGQKTGWSVVFGTVVALLVIVWIWWQQQQAPTTVPPAQARSSTAVTTGAAEPVAEPEPATVTVVEAETPAAEQPELVVSPPTDSTPEDTATGAATAAAALVAEPEPVPVAPPEPEATPESVTDAAAESIPAGAIGSFAIAGGPGEGDLEFSFSDDCWLEVRDGSDQLIYADLHTEGDRISLDGEPPFQVLAGNAAALAVSYRGESVTVVTRPGRDTARFTVGDR
jgi:cytoskeleton protein RodZ